MCTTVEIPVPSQSKLHKQWCLFDQEDNIDFDRQVCYVDIKKELKKKLIVYPVVKKLKENAHKFILFSADYIF